MKEGIFNWDEDNSLMITPLLDIIFLVLIFFALNLSFSSYRDLSVSVPGTANMEHIPDEDQYQLIEITQAGAIYFNKEKTDLDQFYQRTEEVFRENPNEVFYIAAEEKATYSIVMKVLDYLTLTGIESIHLLSKED